MPMRDDFTHDREDYIDIGPNGGKRFSHHLWNTKLLPLARKVGKLRHVQRVRISFDAGKGPTYLLTALTNTYSGSGWVFGIRPVSNAVHVHGRDVGMAGSCIQLNHWDEILHHVKTHTATERPLQ
jgi:hypothetical protein